MMYEKLAFKNASQKNFKGKPAKSAKPAKSRLLPTLQARRFKVFFWGRAKNS